MNAFVGQKPVYDGIFEKKFMDSLGESFDETFSKRMMAGSFLVREAVLYRMKGFLEKERERNPKKIIALEKTYSGNFDLGGGSYVFESRIDRIDELENGAFLIIDYKTGVLENIRVKSSLPEDAAFSRKSLKKYIGSFQLPIYVRLFQRQMEGKRVDAALYDLRASELISFFKDDDENLRKEKIAFCDKALEFIIAEINDPSVPFAPDDSNQGKCSACPYFYMCR
jgi:PD-(D/E)XK nuclease superfamily